MHKKQGYFGIFWDLLPRNEKKRLLYFGYPKRNDLKQEDIYISGNVWERKEETKVKKMETSCKYLKFREQKSRFHDLCPKVPAMKEHLKHKLLRPTLREGSHSRLVFEMPTADALIVMGAGSNR